MLEKTLRVYQRKQIRYERLNPTILWCTSASSGSILDALTQGELARLVLMMRELGLKATACNAEGVSSANRIGQNTAECGIHSQCRNPPSPLFLGRHTGLRSADANRLPARLIR